MLKILCDRCGFELKELGALLFSPPEGQTVIKRHLCIQCYADIVRDW